MSNFRQKTNEDWTSNDYYNRYIETKQFYNFPVRIYRRHEYNEIKDRLMRISEHFNYILNKLQPEDKEEFKRYYKSDLSALKNKQTQFEFIELINDFIQAIDVTPQQVENVKPDINNFILNVNNKKEFLNDLSSTFTIEKGKSIEAIIKILVENKIFNIPNRTKRQFIDLLRNEFKQNIGEYSGINDAERKKPFDNIFLEPIKDKLNPLIKKHKAN